MPFFKYLEVMSETVNQTVIFCKVWDIDYTRKFRENENIIKIKVSG